MTDKNRSKGPEDTNTYKKNMVASLGVGHMAFSGLQVGVSGPMGKALGNRSDAARHSTWCPYLITGMNR